MKDAELALKGLTVWGWGAGRWVIRSTVVSLMGSGCVCAPGRGPTQLPHTT